MGAGNGSRFWISGWWRKVLLLAWRDDFRAPGWALRDPTCARRVARRRNGFRAAREGWGGSLQALAPFRSRCRQGCPQERTCPRSPRDLRPQAGNPGCSPARITGRAEGLTPIAFPKFGNRSLPPSRFLPPSPSSGFLREALPDLHEKFAATGRVASLLACQEPGFRLTFGDDMRHEVVEEPLDTGPGFSRHAQQGLVPRFVAPIRNCFHGMAFRCCAGVTTCGEVNLSSPRPKSRRLCVTQCSTPPAIASSRT